jgi:integrase
VAGIQIRDFDQERGLLRVFGKGQKERTMPLRGPIRAELDLFMSVELPHTDRLPEGDDYLLYPVKTLAVGKTSRNGIIQDYVPYPKRRPSNQSVHRWWYRMAEKAGLVGPGVTSGLNMHQARHQFAVEMRRVAGLDAASHALGHSDVSTTLGIYGHYEQRDLEQAMELYAEYLERG